MEHTSIRNLIILRSVLGLLILDASTFSPVINLFPCCHLVRVLLVLVHHAYPHLDPLVRLPFIAPWNYDISREIEFHPTFHLLLAILKFNHKGTFYEISSRAV